MTPSRLVASTWTIPAIITVSTLAGMGVALFAEGRGDWLAWAALGLPVAVALPVLGLCLFPARQLERRSRPPGR